MPRTEEKEASSASSAADSGGGTSSSSLLSMLSDWLFQRSTDNGVPGAAAVEGKVESSGWRVELNGDLVAMPSTRECYYCSKEGKTHPLEHFVCYPCCGYKVCRGCVSDFCGECLTRIPWGNVSALSFIRDRIRTDVVHRDEHLLLRGRVYVYGCHLFLDELIRIPLYERLVPPCMLLATMNPPMVKSGVDYLEKAAERGVIAAMLDLAYVYNTTFPNDPWQKDKKKAEYWFQRACGQGNRVFPLALTCYGDFLKWEPSRQAEAKAMFQMAAEFGHHRGQYEYAVCLIEGIGKNSEEEEQKEHVCTKEETTEAIKWLCKASENGYYVPSYVKLAKLLIEMYEEEYGTASLLPGRSVLPRALQILLLVEDGKYANSESVRKEAADLLERYDSFQMCANCGDTGSENNPLDRCETCGVTSYCGRICARRHFRDGHRIDCCPRAKLFDFHSIQLRLPWRKAMRCDGLSTLPVLQATQSRNLRQMVDDDTEEIYGEQEMDYDEHLLAQFMIRMRINLETYLERNMKNSQFADGTYGVESSHKVAETRAGDARNLNLKKQIDTFAKYCGVDQDFINAMHKIREYGNTAAHNSPNEAELIQKECEDAVRKYREQKEKYEISKARMQTSENDSEQGISAKVGRTAETETETVASGAVIPQRSAQGTHPTARHSKKRKKKKRNKK